MQSPERFCEHRAVDGVTRRRLSLTSGLLVAAGNAAVGDAESFSSVGCEARASSSCGRCGLCFFGSHPRSAPPLLEQQHLERGLASRLGLRLGVATADNPDCGTPVGVPCRPFLMSSSLLMRCAKADLKHGVILRVRSSCCDRSGGVWKAWRGWRGTQPSTCRLFLMPSRATLRRATMCSSRWGFGLTFSFLGLRRRILRAEIDCACNPR